VRPYGILLGLLLSACCPDPQPASDGAALSDGVGGGTSLSVIQTQIFDHHCVTDCHEATSPAANLRLNPGKSHENLVNVASKQVTSQVRVIPGNADRSYLVRKLEGGPGIVGDQMPRLAPARPQAEIDQVRVWITRGAPND